MIEFWGDRLSKNFVHFFQSVWFCLIIFFLQFFKLYLHSWIVFSQQALNLVPLIKRLRYLLTIPLEFNMVFNNSFWKSALINNVIWGCLRPNINLVIRGIKPWFNCIWLRFVFHCCVFWWFLYALWFDGYFGLETRVHSWAAVA